VCFVQGTPLIWIDPSGHNPECGPDGIYCDPGTSFEERYGVKFNNWTEERSLSAAKAAIKAVAGRLGTVLHTNSALAFQITFKYGINFTMGLSGATNTCATITSGGCTSSSLQINFATISSDFLRARNNVGHEIGHAFENLWSSDAKNREHPELSHPANVLGWTQSFPGYPEYFIKGFPNRTDFPNPVPENYRGEYFGFASRQNDLSWQVSVDQAGAVSEEFADQFLGWTYRKWEDSGAGDLRSGWMEKYMPLWIHQAAGR
jgi:hypothetical protein